jgi:hypothetical protein
MPKVGKEEFAYTKAGKQAAKDFAKETGQEVSYFGGGTIDARNRSQNLDFNTMYQEGGTIYEKNEAERKRIKEAGKKTAEENRKKADARKAKRAARKAARKVKRTAKKEARKEYRATKKEAKDKLKGKKQEARDEYKKTIKSKDRPKDKLKSPNIGSKYKGKDFKLSKPKGKYGESPAETAKLDKEYKAGAVSKPKPKQDAHVEKPIKKVKTKGGDYPVHHKSSDKAKEFRSAYAKAPKGSVFTWDGRKYKKD